MNARRVALTMLVLCCVLACGLGGGSGVSLGAVGTHTFAGSFGSEGHGKGQFGGSQGTQGVAVNETTHNVYVVDSGDKRVEEFNSTGTEVIREFDGSNIPAGSQGSGPLKNPSAIAVDNSDNPLVDPSAGDVYVVDQNENHVYSPAEYVIDKFNEKGEYLGQWTGTIGGSLAVDTNGVVWGVPGEHQIDSFSNAEPNEFLSAHSTPYLFSVLAVDSEDNLYGHRGNEFFAKIDSSGNPLIEEIGAENHEGTAAAVDQVRNDVYLDTSNGIERFGPDGNLMETFAPGYSRSNGMAVDGTDGTLYLAFKDEVLIFTAAAVPDVSTVSVSGLAVEGSATLSGSVNPDGEAVTNCEFEYGTEVSYGQVASCTPSPGSGSEAQQVHAVVGGLEPGVAYHYRLVAGNANGSNQGVDRVFVDPRHPSVDEQSTADVAAGSVKLDALINPGGLRTTYRFEYGLTSSYGVSVPVSGGEAGSELNDVAVSVELQGLQAHTTYHWRVVASSEVEPVAVGPDQVFTTQTTGGSVGLADGREWELVSPPSKNGMQIIPSEGAVIQASEDGSGIAYYASGPFVAEPGGNVLLSQALAERGSDGWSSQDIAPPRDRPVLPTQNVSSEYQFFSPDLSHGLLEARWETNGYPDLSPKATERTPYIRDNATSVYEPLVTASNVSPGTQFGTRPENIRFVTATPDLSHVILKSNLNLTTEGTTENIILSSSTKSADNYYEAFDGRLRFINVLPAGEPSSLVEGGEVTIGSPAHLNVRHAVSDDGSRVFWGTEKAGSGDDELYMRDVVTGESVRVNKAQGVAEPNQNSAEFQFASSDGSDVFFTEPNQLTTTLGSGLYMYDVPTGKLTLLTVAEDPSEALGGGVRGAIVGASEDGSYVYLVSGRVLRGDNQNGEGEQAVAGDPNLYVSHGETHDGTTEWSSSFIADLSGGDSPDWGIGATREFGLGKLTARVSPDGGFVAFMSDKSLTGYDNRDVNSGELDEEVYEYSAATGRLVCASCNPTGARPSGHVEGTPGDPTMPDLNIAWSGRWVAASVPGWYKADSEDKELALYQPRYLSDNGRLFFDSPDALVPQDTNGVEDVYEYEPEGTGDCSAGTVTYGAGVGGCVGLISGGRGEKESVFTDASVNGNDVFFVTTDRLAPADIDSEYDMYDAHACTSEVPCFAAPVALPPPCDTVDSCKAAPTPQPVIFGSPASATFVGAGNLIPVSSVKAKAKPKKKPVKKKVSKRKQKRKAEKSVRSARRSRVGSARKGSAK